MLTKYKPGVVAILAVFFSASSIVKAQGPALQTQLEAKYALTTINAEGAVVTQGVTLTLKKPGFIGGAKSCTLDYKNGALALSGTSRAACTAGKASNSFLGGIAKSRIPGLGSAPDSQATRPFVAGEKLWVTKIAIAADMVSFSLVSDTINNAIYYGVIRFQPQPGAAPDAGHVDQTFGEMFSVAAPDTKSDTAQQTAAPAPPAGQAPPQQPASPALAPIAPPPQPPDTSGAALAPIAPPPPPSDQPVQTVSMGMTEDQVVGIMGQPTTKADLGTKKIYSYKSPGLKVIFVDGKVTDIQ